MKKVYLFLLLGMVGLCLSACTWPKVFVRTSNGYVSYDRLNHRLEVIWESTMQTPQDTVVSLQPVQSEGVIEK